MPHEIQWTRDFDASLAAAKEKGKLVLLDFSAPRCEPAALGWMPRYIRIPASSSS